MHSAKNTSPLTVVPATPVTSNEPAPVRRVTSAALMQDQREVEIEHNNKIYRLRITQLGKLILTA
ncbi:hemin uptake protein HemP [Duganella sp. FT92W]|uniref:Hemin uptake protein HemP n=1 Tax=Pseudoduganella rivuli TaxID=2666085 RepID=A0A7X2IV79_9BURK|nr:hemin uptake protein HemP [Pseudoduganella rivuli]MRV76550.1 hemin uptake protein HemP [Pseudoduganella rivuli]